MTVTTVALPEDLLERIATYAAALHLATGERVSRSAVVRVALEHAMPELERALVREEAWEEEADGAA